MATLRKNSTAASRKRRGQLKRRWTLDEDELLRKLVERHGPGNWRHVAYHMRGKSKRSCRLRWINQLDPRVDRTPFSEEESRMVLDLNEKHGNKWSIIASHFEGRTDNQVKNQYHTLLRRENTKPSGSQFSDGSCQGNNQIMPVFDGGSSSVNGKGETWVSFSSVGDIHPGQGGDSLMSDAASAAFPEQGGETQDYQFIDFMGVGSSE